MYYLFAGSFYYPNGGVSDLIGTYQTFDKAKGATLEIGDAEGYPDNPYYQKYDWAEIAVIRDNTLTVIWKQ